jgi:hypothetical protein
MFSSCQPASYCDVSEETGEFFNTQAGLAENSSEGAGIQLSVVGDYHLTERILPAKDQVAAVLAFQKKAQFHQHGNALPPGDPR